MYQKCIECDENLLITNFNRKKTNPTYFKTCKICIAKIRKDRLEHYTCDHNKYEYQCKKCNPGFNLIARMMVTNSMMSDKKSNRFEASNFIDVPYMIEILEDCQNICCYCNKQLDFVNYSKDMATIERLNNNLPHCRGNIGIACRGCNFSRVGV